VRSLTWLLLAGALLAAVAVASGSNLLTRIPAVGETAVDAVGARDAEQGAAQISSAEFVQVDRGVTTEQLRALVGEPESSSRARVEGIELDCLYYGIVGASGAFQFCFADDRLVSRFRFDASAG
jgi:hypothetical protein